MTALSLPQQLEKLKTSAQWKFFGELYSANTRLAILWLLLIMLRGLIPIALVIAVGQVVGTVAESGSTDDSKLLRALAVIGFVYVSSQMLASTHSQLSANLGDRMSSYLQDQLLDATLSPLGHRHMESSKLADRLAIAKDFDLGRTGPPMEISIGIITGGLVELIIGLGQLGVIATYSWWLAIIVGMAWASTHWLLRESAAGTRLDSRIQSAQRRAEYTYRLAVDPPAAKEVRLFGLSDWVVNQFAENSRKLVDLRWEALRIRERPMVWAIAILILTNIGFFGFLTRDIDGGSISLQNALIYGQAAVAVSALAFGGLNWAFPPAAESVKLISELRKDMSTEGHLTNGDGLATDMPQKSIVFQNLAFTYPDQNHLVLDGLSMKITPGTSNAIVGVNGAGKTTLVKLACRLYDPDQGKIMIDDIDLRSLDVVSWRNRIAVVFQDFVRYDLTVRDNVAPNGAPDHLIWESLGDAGVSFIGDLDTVLAKGYDDGTDLSGGQWQRIAVARALCAVKQGASLIILDEPTAQLDVRGELEVFDQILASTKNLTTVLVSHRFSTVKRVDNIFVVEDGRVLEQGSHDELMAIRGRYREMFELQASRFETGNGYIDD